jgi:diguanylate cyclase (GGDEF)-like protein
MPKMNGYPMATRLLRQTLVVIWTIIIGLLTIDILVDYQTLRSDNRSQLDQQLTIIQPAIANSMSAGDVTGAREILVKLLADKRILRASLRQDDGRQVVNAVKQSATFLDPARPDIRLEIPTASGTSYWLHMNLDMSTVDSGFVKRWIAMAVITILAMSLISVLLFILFDRKLAAPIRKLNNQLANRETGSLEPIILEPQSESQEIQDWLEHSNHILDSVRKMRSKESIAKAEASRLRRFDELTDLPNRSYFLQQLNQRIHLAKATKQQPALLLFGLDGFSAVNSAYGTAIGDKLLVAVTQRMAKHRGQNQFISRIAGDQFALLSEHIEHNYEAGQLAQSLLHAIARPFSINDKRLQVSASVGIAMYPQDAKSAEQLLEHADKAMHQAKQHGRNQYQYYLASTDAKMRRRKALEDALRNAPKTGQLSLLYQPKFNILDNRVCGAEALIRWKHPEFGMVSPDEFIPIAESSSLIIPIGAWVIQHACAQLAEWHKMGHEQFQVAVNLSAVQLKQPGILATIEAGIREHNIPPANLVLEITETAVIDDIERSIEVLNDLHTLGVSIAMDDFGTGYSSLNYLKRLPLHQIKIDKSFIDDVGKYPKDDMIIQSIIQLAHNLNLRVVAEGVETYSQHEFLMGLRCQEGQGYFYSPPMRSQEFQELIFDNQFISTDSNAS